MSRSVAHVSWGTDTLVRAEVPHDLGWSDWVVVDQARIDRFAAATDDDQWIHVDPERAAAGPYGSTIAHGLLTLALAPRFVTDLMPGLGSGSRGVINRGVQRATFRAPVTVGARVRAQGTLVATRPLGDYLEVTVRLRYEQDRGRSPGSADLLLLV